jgi:hypothetical protein
MKRAPLLLLALIAAFALEASPAFAARNASFLNPNDAGKTGDAAKNSIMANTLVADPATVDAGETLVNVARRITVFFFNGFRIPVDVQGLTLNADGNVRSKVLSDDCAQLKKIPTQDRCAIALEVTPSSPGPWSVELLVTHSGQGRIARAEVTGSTLGKADERSEGLAISKKISAPLDFGTVKVNEEKAARTLLIENDSTEPLVISSIDLISVADGDLSLRKSGCKEGDHLKPGESCPVTVMWEPHERGNVATDLILRHSGNLGFVVVPIRGIAAAPAIDDKGGGGGNSGGSSGGSGRVTGSPAPVLSSDSSSPKPVIVPMPAAVLAEKLPSISADSLRNSKIPLPMAPAPDLVLIGTVGGRAILSDANNQTYMVALGEKTVINGAEAELLQLDPTRAVIHYQNLRLELTLRRAPTIATVKDTALNVSADSGPSAPPPSLPASNIMGGIKPATPPAPAGLGTPLLTPDKTN